MKRSELFYVLTVSLVLGAAVPKVVSIKQAEAESSNTEEASIIHNYMLSGKATAEKQYEALVSDKRDAEIAKTERNIDLEIKTRKKARAKKIRRVKKITTRTAKQLAAAKVQMKELRVLAKKKVSKAKPTVKSSNASITYYSIGSAGNSAGKCWMPHKSVDGSSIFAEGTPQWNLQQRAYTGDYGIRMVDGRYCIAMGSRFCSKIGTKIDILLENGRILPCILGDQKDDRHTDSTNSYDGHGCYVEFVVDRDALNSTAKRLGYVSAIDYFSGKIITVGVYN